MQRCDADRNIWAGCPATGAGRRSVDRTDGASVEGPDARTAAGGSATGTADA